MAKVKVCGSCGVPREFSREHDWNSDGSISQKKNPDHRVIFYETEGINLLLANISELVGIPIDRIAIEGKRKSTFNYASGMFSGMKLVIIKALLRRKVYETIAKRGALLGYGHYELLDFKPGEFLEIHARNTYSRIFFSGDIAGVFNVVEGLPAEVTYEERDDGLAIRVVPGAEVEEMAQRLERVVLPRKPGAISYQRCPECGLPLDFKDYRWDVDDGSITDKATGRRMAILGAEGVESVFRELEAELGEELPRTIVEAQRRYVVEVLGQEEVRRDPSYLTRQVALRGMGNVVEFELERGSLRVVVENALPPLLVAGMLQGIFDLLSGGSSDLAYRRDGGTLILSLKASREAS
ncbi:MAG: hypothetical protein AB1384_01910 [Actinomycetota bacterium]